MNINFPPVDAGYIKTKVESGYYSNATEMVRDAVRRMREQDDHHGRLLAALEIGEHDIAAGRTVCRHAWSDLGTCQHRRLPGRS